MMINITHPLDNTMITTPENHNLATENTKNKDEPNIVLRTFSFKKECPPKKMSTSL